MNLALVDWLAIAGFFAVALVVGVWTSRRSGKNSAEFFLAGRRMPWWLLGTSMVATTFSTDTPNLVTDIVRQNGVAGKLGVVARPLTRKGILVVALKYLIDTNVLSEPDSPNPSTGFWRRPAKTGNQRLD